MQKSTCPCSGDNEGINLRSANSSSWLIFLFSSLRQISAKLSMNQTKPNQCIGSVTISVTKSHNRLISIGIDFVQKTVTPGLCFRLKEIVMVMFFFILQYSLSPKKWKKKNKQTNKHYTYNKYHHYNNMTFTSQHFHLLGRNLHQNRQMIQLAWRHLRLYICIHFMEVHHGPVEIWTHQTIPWQFQSITFNS